MNASHTIQALLDQLNTVIIGKKSQVRDALVCLLAGGHLLIEDTPGVGKTTLAHALAQTLGMNFSRVQFTSDLMPSDLSGVSIFDPNQKTFVFHPGPVFTQVLLADEINRASPRTQSALLEAMEERQVTIDGQTRALPQPFFVLATQNPLEQQGTHALPESQLDRFLMRISLGYPDASAEKALLCGQDRRQMLAHLPGLIDTADFLALQTAVRHIHASPALLDYLMNLIQATRDGRWFSHGLSPRAGLAVLQAARAFAMVDGRDHVSPDDVRAVWVATTAHRLQATPHSGRGTVEQARHMLSEIALA